MENDYIQIKGSYLIIDNIVEIALNLKILDVAEKWAEIAMTYDVYGERAFEEKNPEYLKLIKE